MKKKKLKKGKKWPTQKKKKKNFKIFNSQKFKNW